MKKIAIIGYGRFGKLLRSILEKDFSIVIYDPKLGFKAELKDVYNTDAVFFCVPISQFENVIKAQQRYFNPRCLLIDVLSVKSYPQKVLEKYLTTEIQALLTHPMFGPDSVRMAGLKGQPLIIDRFKANSENYNFWKNYFCEKELNVIEMSANKHDLLAAKSQGVTHFVGRVLKEYNFVETQIDSLGAKKLHEVMDQTCNDTWDLFVDLQNKNPYTKKMRLAIGNAYNKIYNDLLPKQIHKDYLTIGIQGGKASFNDNALLDYVKRHGIKKYKIKYLYTTEKVLKNLHYGNIDLGLFAMHNSVGGMVSESITAIAKYRFEIVEEFAIKIQHFLMKLPQIQISDIKKVIAHDQVLKQCQATLQQRYSYLKLETGKGDLIDTATAAKAVLNSKLDQHTFILGNRRIADIYGFEVVDSDLQDDKQNYTSFLMVKRAA